MTILIMTAVLAAENESLRYVHEGTQAEVLVTDHGLLPGIVAATSLFPDK